MAALEVAHVLAGLPVRDIGASIAWFERVLGRGPDARPMPILADWHFPDGQVLQVVVDTARAGGGMVTFEVPDIADARRQLRTRGIAFDFDGESSPRVAFGQLTDPDGNSITLVEAKGGFTPTESR